MKTTKHSFTAACAVLALVGLTGAVAQTGLITFEGPNSSGVYGSDNSQASTVLTTEGDYRAAAPTTILPPSNPRGGNNIPGLTMTRSSDFLRFYGRRGNASEAHTGTGAIVSVNTAQYGYGGDANNPALDPSLIFSMDLNITSFWYINEGEAQTAPIEGLDANDNVLWTTGASLNLGANVWREYVLPPADAAMATRKLRINPHFLNIDDISATAATTGYPAWADTNVNDDQPHVDTNHDGVLNGVAYFMDQAGLITLPSVVTAMDGTKTVTWPNAGKIAHTQYNAGSGEWFVVQTSIDLQTWNSVELLGGNLTNDPSFVRYTLTEPAPIFVRLKVIIP